MRKILATLGLAAILAGPAFAHDFWIQPQTFQLAAPGAVPIRFLIGDHTAEPWATLRQKITALRAYGPGGVVDQQASIREGEANGGATATFKEPGAYVLALESTHGFIELAPDECQAYLAEDHVMPIILDRDTPEKQAKPCREMYSRRAKALIKVGEGSDDIYIHPIGMTLEIVPEKCPYHLEHNEALPVRVYFHGQPLANAQVSLGSLDNSKAELITHLTDAEGRTSFALDRTGKWRLALVWSEPLTDRKYADYDTTFSSLTFGF